jgi:hypothetical protein
MSEMSSTTARSKRFAHKKNKRNNDAHKFSLKSLPVFLLPDSVMPSVASCYVPVPKTKILHLASNAVPLCLPHVRVSSVALPPIRIPSVASDGQKAETSKSRILGKMSVVPVPKKAETSKSRNLGKMSVVPLPKTKILHLASNAVPLYLPPIIVSSAHPTDKRLRRRRALISASKTYVNRAFVDLSLTAQLFLQAQGITSALKLLKTLTPVARSFLSSQGIAAAEAFLSTNTATTASGLVDWRKRACPKDYSIRAAQTLINTWHRGLRKGRSCMSEEPLVERNAGLKAFRPMAHPFLSSQGITTTKAFLLVNTTTMVSALVDWRNRWDSSECSFSAARKSISQWKVRLRELRSSLVSVQNGESYVNANG